jgi:hypothetical protein
MNPISHPNLSPTVTKLFTVGCGQNSAALALPTLNNFG